LAGAEIVRGSEVHLVLADGFHARGLVTRIVDAEAGTVDIRLIERPNAPRWSQPVRDGVTGGRGPGTWHLPTARCGRGS
jgi:hypothetical protein